MRAQAPDRSPREGLAGPVEITSVNVRSLLTPASGFIGEFDYTLNPYAGCAFGCHYCYAAFFARNRDLVDSWGRWVRVKDNALALLRHRRVALTGKTIYMSSVTDPYQPVEAKLGLVRGLLEELLRDQPRLVIQTRSPLVTRDIDLLTQFTALQVNMTVTTDSEPVRRVFEPACPPNAQRLDAIKAVARAGIRTAITLTPLLPIADPDAFGRRLANSGAQAFVVQPFHARRGRFTAGTREPALRLLEEHGWDDERHRATVEALRRHVPTLQEGRDGFAPI